MQLAYTDRPRKWLLAIVLVTILLVVSARIPLHAQTDTIFGITNRYTIAKVIDDCNSSIVVRNPVGFAAGDRVLIIQMKGAEISTANDSTFGDILDYHNAGNYELATVDEVNQWTLVLHNRLARTYDVSGIVQVIRVPVYANAYVGATLTAKAWDGQTGGVLALIVTGTLTLGADIDVSGKGFRGGEATGTSFSISGVTDYFFAQGSEDGGSKGEGIVQTMLQYYLGRGKFSSGGGGGNARASGGGGGGNAGTGGHGGKDARYGAGAPAVDIGGHGGLALTYSNSSGDRRVFLGGGGGAGGREDVPPDVGAERGGGIVLVQAGQVSGNGHAINADGADNTTQVVDYVHLFGGGGGGGAGGVILVDVSTFTSSTIVSITGGDGMSTSGTSYCIGPGGGGGGGCAWFSPGSVPANVVIHDQGGAHGITGIGTQCSSDGFGASDGGTAVTLTNLVIPTGSVPR